MSSLQKQTERAFVRRRRKNRHNLWFERIIAILALLNLLLVLFDVSYIPLRDFWLHRKVQVFSFKIGPLEYEGFPLSFAWLIPDITELYDPFKGIVEYRDTKQYLEKVDKLENELNDPDVRSQEIEIILADLRRRSIEMIDTNPFQVANKTGTLEKIKNEMLDHLPNPDDSSKQAFDNFWTQENIINQSQELDFFNKEIRPLIETNYFRPIGENGKFVDLFGLIDFPFFVVISLEFLARTWWISKRRTGVSWLDAMLWRWYDIFFLIPIWRWLRIIPVTIRLEQARLIDLSRVAKQIRQGFVAEIAEDMTEVVVIQVINEAQRSIREGDITKLILQQEERPYIDLNDTDEVAELTTIMLQMVVHRILPKIRPDLEALLQHNLNKLLNQSPVYQGLSQVPGMGELQNQLSTKFVKDFTQVVSDSLESLIEEDPVGEQLLRNLIEHLTQVAGSEIQAEKRLQEIQYLLTALLEEVKVNYVEHLSEEDLEEILDQTRAIRQISQK
ncbi:MAG: hypothetical protein F6K36_18340 [Symploca sp. SIO3C6]|uniref:Ion transporter n=1 Tax=Symploca sp. SIO1C4 TaxID=2607765 RepID=A0A6B3NMH1_9CYAN|nr:hypothetical protein [Symploca sp. SIO3C6]NER32105.1 hypothetical protein [Symploca sp. SIO1C4]